MRNTGLGSISISKALVTGSDAAAFSLVNNCSFVPLEGGSACAISVTFSPTDAGSVSANLEITNSTSSTPLSIPLSGSATSVSWKWDSGSNTVNAVGEYGTQSVPSSSTAPGGRHRAVSWTDSAGALWVFGGYGFASAGLSGSLNDLWKYDPMTRQWTWVDGANTVNAAGVYGVQGVASPANSPGCRDSAVSWTDSQGNFWLFGGWCQVDPRGNYPLNDLWKYDPSSAEWIWVSGSSTSNTSGVYGTRGVAAPGNMPGSRYGAVSWVDASDNLWLFGGFGVDATGQLGTLNDLWKYSPNSGEWIWISGSNTADAPGDYGTLGVPAASNAPPARYAATSWSAGGHLWLFGGTGISIATRNDLWKYDPANDQWTWVSGANATNAPGRYGTVDDVPGARAEAAAWTDASDNLWLFGGNFHSDLWKYSPTEGRWTWVSGPQTRQSSGVYGTPGVSSPNNHPGGRSGAVGWRDLSGQLWMFGGQGYASSSLGALNDLWNGTP